MSLEDTLVISGLLNFVLFSVLVFVALIIKTKLWEFFRIGWKLWRNKSLVLVGRLSGAGICRFNVEELKDKIAFGVRDRDDIVINKKTYQRMEDISSDSLEEKLKKENALNLKKIHPQRIRLANGVPLVMLREGYHENLDLVNDFKPELDAQQVNDAISQAFEDGFKEGEGSKSNLEKIITYTMYIGVAVLVFTIINLALSYMAGENIAMLMKVVSGLQGQITALAGTAVSNSAVEFV